MKASTFFYGIYITLGGIYEVFNLQLKIMNKSEEIVK